MKTSLITIQTAQKNPQSTAWTKLVTVYAPLISGWMRRCGVHESDLSDLTQEVLIAIVRHLPKFDHNGRVGAFRRWLKLITINHCRRYWDRRQKSLPQDRNADPDQQLKQLADPNSGLSRIWDHDHDMHVLQGMLGIVRNEFDAQTMDVFTRTTFSGETPAAVAKKLNVSVGQIYKFRFRVMQRLREEAASLLEAENYPAEPSAQSLGDSTSPQPARPHSRRFAS